MQQKLVPDLFIISVNNPKQPLNARKSLKEDILKVDYQKALKKITLFSPSNPVPFNRQNYQKQKGRGTSDQSLFKTSSEKFLYYLCII